MSDFEDDSECLKIHLGGKLSESSDSGDDNELDEEYHLLRPSPIPADIIRQKSIYRPPSPIKDANNCNLLNISKEDEAKKIVENLSAAKDKKQQKVELSDLEKVISLYLEVNEHLIKMPGEIVSFSNKLSLAYLEILEMLQINVDFISNSFGNIDLEYIAINSAIPSELLNLKNKIDDFNILLSYVYAFIISEYLLILSQAAKFRKSKVNAIVIETLHLINKLGDIDEISRKIKLRSSKKMVNSNVDNMVPLLLNNEDIISRLYLLSPKIDKNKKRRKKATTKKISLEAYADNKQTVFSDKNNVVPKTSNNIEKKSFYNDERSLIQMDLMENDNNISSVKIQDYESSVFDRESHPHINIIENIVLSVPSPKRKRNKKKKKSLGGAETMKMFETENSSKDNNNTKQNSELHISDAKTYIGHTNKSHISDHIESEEMDLSEYLSKFDTTSQIFNGMNNNEMKTVIFSLEILVKAINAISVLQYAMNTFEIKHNKSVITLLNDCIKILKNIEYYNKLLFVLCPTELIKSLEEYFIPISELCLAHFYAYFSNFCCVFVKTSSNQDIQDKSKELNLQIIEIIKSLGSIQYIHSKLKFRNDELYFQLAQKVCVLTPVISTTSNNTEILEDLSQIADFSYDERLDELELENIAQKRNEVLQIVINTILPRKLHDIENLQLDLKRIEILSILEDDIFNRAEYTTELESLFENMKNFSVLLGQLEEQEDSQQENDGMVNNILLHINKIELATLTISTTLKKILNRCVIKVFISHFYCFFLFMFVRFFDLTTADEIKKQHSFLLELFEKLIFFCPLQKLPEKIEFRNDAIYEKYMKILLPLKGVLVYTSSWNILSEALSVFKVISSIYSGYPYLGLHAQVEEFERNTLRTKKLIEGIDFSGAVSSPIEKKRKRSKRKKELPSSAESTEVFDTYDTLKDGEESKQNSKVLSRNLDKDCDTPKKSTPICENNQIKIEGITFSEYPCNYNFSSKIFDKLDFNEMETVIISMEKIIKGINIMNTLLYSMDTFEMKYPKSVITLLNDCTIILKNVSTYNNALIDMCSKELLNVVETYYIPVSELYLAHSYAYLSYFYCKFINAIEKKNTEGNTEEIYLDIIKVIESLGTFEHIHSKLQFRNDELYVELAQKVCSLTPIICCPASNIELLQALSQIGNCLEDGPSIEFDSAKENNVQNKNEGSQIVINTILPRKSQKVKNFQFGLKTIWILSILQDNIYCTIKNTSEMISFTSCDFTSLFDKMRNFLVHLGELEKQEENVLKNHNINFYDSVNAEKLDLDSLGTDTILNRHILRTLVSHFYSFFLLIFVVFYELSSETEENQHNFNLDLLQTLDSICPLQKLPEKLEFRNDAVCEEYMKMLLHIEGVSVGRSSWNILNEVLTIFKMILNVDNECPPEDLCARVEEFERNTFWTEKLIEEKYLFVEVSSSKSKESKKKKKLPSIAESANVSEIEDISKIGDSRENKQNLNILNMNDAKIYFDHKKEEGKKSDLNDSSSEKKRKTSKKKKDILSNVESTNVSEIEEAKDSKENSKMLKIIDHEKEEGEKIDMNVSSPEKKTGKRSKKKKKSLSNVESTIVSEMEDLSKDSKENKQNLEILKINDAKNDCDHEKVEGKKSELKVLCIKDVENGKNGSAVTLSSSRMEVTYKVVELLKSCSKCEVRNIIIEMMNNPEIADISRNSVMRKIEYSITKAITVSNVIQYSFNTFDKQNSIGASLSLLECFTLVRSFEKFSSLLLSLSASSKLKKIETLFVPIAKMYEAHCYAYILSNSCKFIRLLEYDTNNTENEIYSRLLNMVNKCGTLEDIYEKLKYRNDCCYFDIVRQLCTVIPSTLRLAGNEHILQNIPCIEHRLENKIPFKISKKGENQKEVESYTKNMNIRFSIVHSEFECSQIDLKRLKIIMDLQYDINFHDQFPTNFSLVLEYIINFFINLKAFEHDEHQLSAYGNFVDKFLQISENILRIHISRILLAQFYSFIYSACIDFLKNLTELVPKNEVSFFQTKLINLFSTNCSVDEVFKKMQFRNDTIFSQYISDVLKMKMIKVDKSYAEIHSEVLSIFNMN